MTGRAGAGPGSGRLVLVGTPIGNLGDLSPRAAAALGAATVIFCEDTRRTRKLLSATGIPAPRLVVMHQHNEAAAAEQAVGLAAAGATVVVVTDAGLPGISDPGERAVARAAAAGVAVEVVPGPSASLTALVGSGLPAGRFCFEGFLPRRGTARQARLSAIAARDCTTVLYEAPHRVRRTLVELAAACGVDRAAAVGRELTKRHEQLWRGNLGAAVAWADQAEPRGEWVLVVGAAPDPADEVASEDEVRAALQARLQTGEDRRQAVTAVAAELHRPKREVYRVAVGLGRPGQEASGTAGDGGSGGQSGQNG